MLHKSKTFSVSIHCPSERVYTFVSNPANLPQWATSFVQSVERVGDNWIGQTADGPMTIAFVPKNDLGVLDHVVKPAPDVEVSVPMRVVANGSGSEVVFTLFQMPGMSDDKFATDIAMVERDLATLKEILERESA